MERRRQEPRKEEEWVCKTTDKKRMHETHEECKIKTQRKGNCKKEIIEYPSLLGIKDVLQREDAREWLMQIKRGMKEESTHEFASRRDSKFDFQVILHQLSLSSFSVSQGNQRELKTVTPKESSEDKLQLK
jgi:hypothetical protein